MPSHRQHGTLFDTQRALLTPPQRATVRTYLTLLAYECAYTFERPNTPRAIHAYWSG